MSNKTILLSVGALSLMAACGGDPKKKTTVPEPVAEEVSQPEAKPAEPPAPAPAAAALQNVVFFGFDRYDIDEEAKKKLTENATWLKADASRTLTIEGHTDEVGTPEYNLGLGERRARAARDYLIALGADTKKVSIITFGEERPASADDAQNRRSVFIATKK